MQLLVRNKVANFAVWREVFDADHDRAMEYGLEVASLWQSKDDPNEVFFLIDVEDVERAKTFMALPESRESGEKSGVIDGEVYFLKPVKGTD